jgi:hypothetical protein
MYEIVKLRTNIVILNVRIWILGPNNQMYVYIIKAMSLLQFYIFSAVLDLGSAVMSINLCRFDKLERIVVRHIFLVSYFNCHDYYSFNNKLLSSIVLHDKIRFSLWLICRLIDRHSFEIFNHFAALVHVSCRFSIFRDTRFGVPFVNLRLCTYKHLRTLLTCYCYNDIELNLANLEFQTPLQFIPKHRINLLNCEERYKMWSLFFLYENAYVLKNKSK